MENGNRPSEETPEEIEEKERQAKIRWQIYAAGLDPARAAPPAPGYGLDGYPLQRGKSEEWRVKSEDRGGALGC